MATTEQSFAQIQSVVRHVFTGIAPEREAALSVLWDKYSLQFHIVAETSCGRALVMESGAYCQIRFSVRTLRVFWLSSFMAWEGYTQVHNVATRSAMDLRRLNHMHEVLDRILTASDPWTVPMPEGVPEPGHFPDATAPEKRLPAELACFAIGWALLHEIRHLQHQHEGTRATLHDPPQEHHKEELSCDAFATTFLLGQIDDYAASEGFDAQAVAVKRELGVYVALFAMTLLGPAVWKRSESHPSMQTRIDSVTRTMGSTGKSASDAIARGAFAALQLKYPNAPTPFLTSDA